MYNKYIYDQVGRKLKTWEQLTSGSSSPTPMTLISNTKYNETGQVYSKQLHSTDSVNYLQSIAYGYNERGWLLSSSAPLFAMQLYYNNGTNKQYNGNIAYQYWGTPGNLNFNYTYTYNKLNRLMSGFSADNYKEQGISYNPSGDMAALSRYQTNNLIDQLTYSYTNAGNPTYQLQSIVDGSGSNTGLTNGTTNYTYDLNGNLAASSNTVNTGQNKSYTYNVLNLPNVVTLPSGNTSTFIYDASGRKLRKLDVTGGINIVTDYDNGIQYNNSYTAIAFVQTEEGQAVPNGTGFDYQYFLGDNLGNTRVTFGTKTGSAVIIQKDDYYPFGLEINRTPGSPKNEYLYNRKELQEETGLYDYGARFYDPLVARWTSIDPLAEKSRRFSPYNYVVDNPIRFIDPDGMDFQNGIYESGLYGNTTAYSASDNQQSPALQQKEAGYENPPENNGSTDQCCVTKPDHSAGKPVPVNSRSFSKISYKLRKAIEQASRTQTPATKPLPMGSIDPATGTRIGSGSVETTDPIFGIIIGFSTGGTASIAELEGLDGSFSISNWEGYPTSLEGIKPSGPFKLLEGSEYQEARGLANQANRALRQANPDVFEGFQIHEIQPVKFGGSPTDLSNKMLLTPQEHRQYSTFWDIMRRQIKK